MQNNKKEKNKDAYDKNDAKGGLRMRRARKKVCSFCMDKVKEIDYKDIAKIKKFTSERGKILPRRITGACALHQRHIAREVKRARFMGLIPFVK